MRHRSLLFAFALISLAGLVQAQQYQVLDKLSLEPVEGALVSWGDPPKKAFTDPKGRIELDGMGAHDTLRVDFIGYVSLHLPPEEWGRLNGKLLLEPRNTRLGAFVFSASRFMELQRDVPEKVEVLDRREIAFLAPQRTGELLQNSGALFVQQSQMGGGSPVIRGFEASRVLLVVDGVRLNNAIYRSGHLQDIMTVDANSLDRMEVVSGPASVVYGSDALGGVVNMMTRSAAFSDSGTVAHGGGLFRFGTVNEEKTAHVDLRVSGRNWSSFTSITASEFGDLRQGSVRNPFYPDFGKKPFTVERINGEDDATVNPDPNVQTSTGYAQLDIVEKLRFRSGPRTVHQLNLQLSTTGDVPRYDRLSQYSVDSLGAVQPTSAEWYYGPQQRLLAAYTLELAKHRWFDQARITPSWQSVDQSRHNRDFNSSWRKDRMETVHVLGLNADLEKRMARHELRYGAEGYFDNVGSTAHRENITTGERQPLSTRYPAGGSTMTNLAAYLTDSYEWNDHWVLSAGVRYTRVALRSTFAGNEDPDFLSDEVRQDNGSLNWKAGAVWLPGKEWAFTALASTGFRAPNVDDMGKVFDSSPGQVVVPNPDLGPERTLNVEFGINKTIQKDYEFDLRAFHIWYTDALVLGDFTFNGQDSIDYDGVFSKVTALTNAGSAVLDGGSASFTAHFNPLFTLASSLTYTRGRLHTDSVDVPLDHVPPVFGRTGLSLRVKRLQAECYALYNGWKRLKDYSDSGEDNLSSATAEGTPAWWTLNVRATLAVSANFSIQTAVENIGDVNYRTFSSGVSAPGRNFMLALRMAW
jgi:hemoglobin/transferrin/lactoferrin receptor protein